MQYLGQRTILPKAAWVIDTDLERQGRNGTDAGNCQQLPGWEHSMNA